MQGRVDCVIERFIPRTLDVGPARALLDGKRVIVSCGYGSDVLRLIEKHADIEHLFQNPRWVGWTRVIAKTFR